MFMKKSKCFNSMFLFLLACYADYSSAETDGFSQSEFDLSCHYDRDVCGVMSVLNNCPSVGLGKPENYPSGPSTEYCWGDVRYLALIGKPKLVSAPVFKILRSKIIPHYYKNGSAAFFWCADVDIYKQAVKESIHLYKEGILMKEFLFYLLSPSRGVSAPILELGKKDAEFVRVLNDLRTLNIKNLDYAIDRLLDENSVKSVLPGVMVDPCR